MQTLTPAQTLILALGWLLLAGPSLRAQDAAAPGAGLRHVYVTAAGKSGEAAPALAPADLVLKEDGQVREIVRLEPAAAPLKVALLVDDSGPGLRFIREGVGQFIESLGGRGQMALFSTGGRNTSLVDFTADVGALYQGVRQLVTRTTTGAYLLDGVHEAIGALTASDAERPVVVVLMLEGPEFSSMRADRLLGELRRSGAVLHVVSLGKPTLKTMTAWSEMPTQSLRENLDENINRRKFLEDGTRLSGGQFLQVLVDSGIPAAMRGIAADLVSQYVVVYRRPAGPMPKKLSVSTVRDGVKVRTRADPPR